MFDEDISNDVVKIPENINSTVFYIYMSKPVKEEVKSKEKMDEDEKIIEVLREFMRSNHETKISKPVVDSDESILTPILTGSINKGGKISEIPQVFLKFSLLLINFIKKIINFISLNII